jgi:hypothetical protein
MIRGVEEIQNDAGRRKVLQGNMGLGFWEVLHSVWRSSFSQAQKAGQKGTANNTKDWCFRSSTVCLY